MNIFLFQFFCHSKPGYGMTAGGLGESRTEALPRAMCHLMEDTKRKECQVDKARPPCKEAAQQSLRGREEIPPSGSLL